MPTPVSKAVLTPPSIFRPIQPRKWLKIFKKHVEMSGYELPEGWKEPVTAYFADRVNDENFGNGREARALFEKVSVQMAKRLMGSENGEQKNTLSEKP